jgi:Fe-S-cluster containining protein
MSQTLRQSLPQIYADLLPAFFDTPAPEEKKATCDDCAMCAPKGAAPGDGVVYFRPDTKCCTYFPRLPNYLVGAVFRDPEMAEGQRRLRARIAERLGVTPRWLAPPRKYSLLHEASREAAFGRSTALLCPYYEANGGLCTIWKHREADCSTFFCKYTAGADGRFFWRSVDAYLRRVEAKLAAHAASTLVPGSIEPPGPGARITLEELEDRAPSAYGATWGAWEGREDTFYVACHDLVAALSPADFERITAVPEELATLEASHRSLREPTLPTHLVLNADEPPLPVEGGVLVATYSKYEPIKLSPDLLEALRELGPAESVAEVRARLLRDHGAELPEEMLAALYQLRVLVAPA